MRKNNLKNNNKGFSLVELIVVICIMAALIAIIGPQFMKFVGQSKVAADGQQIEEVEVTLKTMATELKPSSYPAEVVVNIPSEEDYNNGTSATITVTNLDQTVTEDLMKEFSGDNWTDDCYLKSTDYANGATVTMTIENDPWKVTVNPVAN